MTQATTPPRLPVVYGIPNCDTVKKARAWLDSQGQAYTFHDFKKQGLPEAALDAWLADLGWEAVVNRRGTTWRQLDAATQAGVRDAASARPVLLAHTSLVKRPVVHWPGAAAGIRSAYTVGFDIPTWTERLRG